MNVILRSLVIALAVSGAIATTYSNAAPAKATVRAGKTSAMPVPRCPLGTPDGCGLNTW